MKISTLALALLTPLSIHADSHSQAFLSTEQMERAAQLRDQARESDLAWTLLESLTVEVGPRMAGSPGDALAVEWGKRKGAELGFDRVYTEPVTFPKWRRGTETARVGGPDGQPLSVTALGMSVGTPAGGLEAEVALFADLEALTEIADGSLDGKIAYIENRMERHRDGSGYGPAVAARSSGPSIAAAKGAAALLIRSIGTDDNRTPHTGLTRYADDQDKIPAAALANPDADQLSAQFRLDAPVSVYLNLDVGMDGEYTSQNVILEMTGRTAPAEIVGLGCHLDSWDLGTGAIDDGSGCALVMAAGHILAQEPLARTLRVVLFANEEQGLWGARSYLDAHADELEKHVVASESDFGAGAIYEFSTRFAPAALVAADQMMQVLSPLGITRGNNNASAGPDWSPMRAAGMAAVRLHQDGTDYFDYHHTANDTLDKVDSDNLKQNLAAWVAFAYLAAQYPGDFGSGSFPPPATP